MMDIKEVLRLHAAWLNGEEKGLMANLREADLRGADLSGADLRGANLREADLRGADLSVANLREADLRGADLTWADLNGADLREANLREADLREADLREANLREADLSGANLTWANLPSKYVSVSQIGSRRGMTTYSGTENKIWCGCFTGTLEKFSDSVEKTHKDNAQYLSEYRAAIAFFKAVSA